MRIFRFLLLCFGFFGTAHSLSLAQSPLDPQPVSASANESRHRIALIIGNAKYAGQNALLNPTNDANLIAETLRKVGFKTVIKTDANRREMIQAISDFGDQMRPGGVHLFYYAGHGVQITGNNYLLPVGEEFQREDEVRYQSVELEQIMAKMDRYSSAVNIVILDSCRNNPFASKTRSIGAGGLAKVDAPVGTLIAFSTAPGQTASDGVGKNSLYTRHLAESILIPGIPIEDVFKRVRSNVRRESGNQQIPWESTSLESSFQFIDRFPEASQSVATLPQPAPPAAASSPAAPSVPTQPRIQTGSTLDLKPQLPLQLQQGSNVTVVSPPIVNTPPVQSQAISSQLFEEFKRGNRKGVYTGEKTTSGLPHGKGRFDSGDGFIYTGSYTMGVATGLGAARWADGNEYEGEFANNLPNGIGQLKFKNGDVFNGTVVDGIPNGRGVMHYKVGSKHSGLFLNSIPNDEGIFIDIEGNRFEGNFKDGELQGRGRIIWNKQGVHEGLFVRGRAEGEGVYTAADGTKYQGVFKAGQLEGQAVITFPDKSIYKGFSRLNRPNGVGVLTLPDGSVSEGNFVDGMLEGERVTYKYSNGDLYRGSVRRGVFSGKGELTRANGESYRGDFNEGIPDGEGELTLPDKSKFVGRFVRGLLNAVGDYLSPDGQRRKSKLVNGQFQFE